VRDGLSILCLVAFAGGLVAAALYDLASFTIPNRVVIIVALAGAGAVLLGAPGWTGALAYAGVALAVLAVGAALFFINVWGAGDAKLLAAIAVVTGPAGAPVLIFWTAMCGGILAGLLLVIRRLPAINRMSVKFVSPALFAADAGVPYGIAIAAGGAIAIIQKSTVWNSNGFLF
jgi:prepilin peptidase CpaA